MQFNGDNFECIRYWPNKALGDAFKQEFKYKNEIGNIIEEKENIKDLGVQLSSNLTYGKHIEKKVSPLLL